MWSVRDESGPAAGWNLHRTNAPAACWSWLIRDASRLATFTCFQPDHTACPASPPAYPMQPPPWSAVSAPPISPPAVPSSAHQAGPAAASLTASWHAGNPYAADSTDELPASPPLWNFQQKLVPTGESIAASLGSNPGGFMKILAWMIRATFLDPRIARQAVLDKAGNGAAIGAFALSMAPAWLYLLLAGNPYLYNSIYHAMIISTVIVSIAGMVATIFILAMLSKGLLGVRLGAGQLMRALAYAQGAAVLGFIPILGILIRLWTIPTSIAAIREISGAGTAKAIVFIVIGGAVTIVAMMLLSPILMRTLVRF